MAANQTTFIEWRNIQDEPTSELWFHLYWNAFRNNQSTWLREDRLRGRADIEDPEDDDWGFMAVDAVRLLGEAEPLPEDLAVDRVVLSGEPQELATRYARQTKQRVTLFPADPGTVAAAFLGAAHLGSGCDLGSVRFGEADG